MLAQSCVILVNKWDPYKPTFPPPFPSLSCTRLGGEGPSHDGLASRQLSPLAFKDMARIRMIAPSEGHDTHWHVSWKCYLSRCSSRQKPGYELRSYVLTSRQWRGWSFLMYVLSCSSSSGIPIHPAQLTPLPPKLQLVPVHSDRPAAQVKQLVRRQLPALISWGGASNGKHLHTLFRLQYTQPFMRRECIGW